MDLDRELAECLTPREMEVLSLVTEGLSNCEIAEALCISVNTVETHLRHIYQKLGVHNRAQAVWYINDARDKGIEQ